MWETVVLTSLPKRPCPPSKPPVYGGVRFQESNVLNHNISTDLAPNTTTDKFGFGWNSGGRLSVDNGGKSYGVKGQGNNMPLTTQAAAYDQNTSIKPKILMVTVAPSASIINPAFSISLKFGAYPWKEYTWEIPTQPS